MLALVLTEPGKYEVKEVPTPEPGPDEVLCKVRGVAICGSDPEIIRGDLAGSWPPSYPFTPGHEWSGEVEKVGPAVTHLSPGDRVAGEAHKGCGHCRSCLEGRYTLCGNYGAPETGHRHYGFTSPGAYAQYIGVDPDAMVDAYLLEEQAQATQGKAQDRDSFLRPRAARERGGEEPAEERAGRRCPVALKWALIALAVTALVVAAVLIYMHWRSGEASAEAADSSAGRTGRIAVVATGEHR